MAAALTSSAFLRTHHPTSHACFDPSKVWSAFDRRSIRAMIWTMSQSSVASSSPKMTAALVNDLQRIHENHAGKVLRGCSKVSD